MKTLFQIALLIAVSLMSVLSPQTARAESPKQEAPSPLRNTAENIFDGLGVTSVVGGLVGLGGATVTGLDGMAHQAYQTGHNYSRRYQLTRKITAGSLLSLVLGAGLFVVSNEIERAAEVTDNQRKNQKDILAPSSAPRASAAAVLD